MCLSLNQASSIQHMGITCESFTLGHNPFTLPLSAAAIHLPTLRPPFISEHALVEARKRRASFVEGSNVGAKKMSASALMGELGSVKLITFAKKAATDVSRLTMAQAAKTISRIEPLWGSQMPESEDYVGEWMSLDEELCDKDVPALMQRQALLQELYESRFASMHRMVGFFVMFHAMGKKVQDFWPKVSFGLLGYDMSRSQSIMRVATTASPVSGSDVRRKMVELTDASRRHLAVKAIQKAWLTKHGVWRHEVAKEGRLTVEDIDRKIARLQKMKKRTVDAQQRRQTMRQSLMRKSMMRQSSAHALPGIDASALAELRATYDVGVDLELGSSQNGAHHPETEAEPLPVHSGTNGTHHGANGSTGASGTQDSNWQWPLSA